MQKNQFANDERSCLGKTHSLENDQIEWSLQKKDIDLAFKDNNYDDNLTVSF
jgi:hypothetical protein